MCGIVGVAGGSNAIRQALLGNTAMQGRGDISAGVAAWVDEGGMQCWNGTGYVAEVAARHPLLDQAKSSIAIGHNRCRLSGNELEEKATEPIAVETNKFQAAMCMDGCLTNAAVLREQLEAQGAIFQTKSQAEIVLHLLARSQAATLDLALVEAISVLQGGFALLLMTKDALYAVRDEFGYRPLCFGKKDRAAIFASESCALDLMRAEYCQELLRGVIFKLPLNGQRVTLPFRNWKDARQCSYELVFHGRPDSIIFGKSVSGSRQEIGRQLAKKAPAAGDIVVPVTDSGRDFGLGYANESRIPLQIAILRNHYIPRRFPKCDAPIGELGIRAKLSVIKELLCGQRVVLVDDSMVHGSTAREIVAMLRRAGAAEVHVRIGSPPVAAFCPYGIYTSPGQLVGNWSVAQICEFIGADTLAFLEEEDLKEALGNYPSQWCTSCFTGRFAQK